MARFMLQYLVWCGTEAGGDEGRHEYEAKGNAEAPHEEA